MKTLFIFAAIFFCTQKALGQSTGDVIKQQAGEGVKEGAKNVTETVGEKVTDKLLNKLFSKKDKKSKNQKRKDEDAVNKNNSGNKSDTTGLNSVSNNPASAPAFQTYSKYDFIPGEKILAFDDFSKDAIGDFPATWNTNSTGEVVTTSSREGHWLMLTKPGKFFPEYIKSLPDNFTFEYDITCNKDFNGYSPLLYVYFITGPNSSKDLLDNWFMSDGKRDGVRFGVNPTGGSNAGVIVAQTFEDGAGTMRNEAATMQFNGDEGKGDRHVHVSIWRQKQRIRVYLNEEKVYDLPRAFPVTKPYTTLLFLLEGSFKNQDRYLLSNLKLAVGDPDTRNKLLTEGKFSTTGILFDVNSSNIRPESYGTLKDIANVLKENSSVHVKIIGHTDSDGDDKLNLALSKKRAESVKEALINEFGIDASRMETDGKGETQPVAPNTTPEGKAQNRRVEFVKQ